MSVCPSVYSFVCPFVRLFVRPSVRLFVCLFVCLSTVSSSNILSISAQLFSHTQLATVASSAVLHDLLRCMITLLLNEHTTVLEDSAQLTRTLNALVLKIIDNSNLTNCFRWVEKMVQKRGCLVWCFVASALLQLMSDNCGGEGSISKFVDLIMKVRGWIS